MRRMRYRDERDALRHRVDNLEQDLAVARKELEAKDDHEQQRRVLQLEERVGALRAMLSEFEHELAQVRAQKPARSRGLVAVAVGGGVALLAVLAAVFLIRSSAEPPPPMPVPQPVVTFAPPPTVAPLPAPEPARPEPPKPPSRTLDATWSAKVTKVTGEAPVKVGATCAVKGKLGADGSQAKVRGVVLQCGDAVLYDLAGKFNGMSQRGGVAAEELAPNGVGQRYAMVFDDVGARTGKPQLSVNTEKRSVALWTESAPAFRVELAADTWSGVVGGEPLLPTTKQTLLATATVAKVNGPAPVRKGDSCRVKSAPAREDKCVTIVECKGRVLYGGEGLGASACTIEGDRVATVTDGTTSEQEGGGDPALSLDAKAGTITVVEEKAGKKWDIALTIDPATGGTSR